MQEDLVKLVRTASGINELEQVSDDYVGFDGANKEVHKQALLTASTKSWTISIMRKEQTSAFLVLCIKM